MAAVGLGLGPGRDRCRTHHAGRPGPRPGPPPPGRVHRSSTTRRELAAARPPDPRGPGHPGPRRRRRVRPLPHHGRRPLPALHQRRRPAPAPLNVPVATSSDFVHLDGPGRRPSRPARLGLSPGSPGHRTCTGSARSTPSTSRPSLAGRTRRGSECIGSAFADSPAGPFTASPTPLDLPARPGRLHRPAGLRRLGRHAVDGLEVRPEHRRGGHPHEDVVAAALRRRHRPAREPVVPALPRRAVAGHHRRGSRHGGGRRRLLGRLLGQLVQPAGLRRRCGPLRRARPDPCRDTSPGPLLASNLQGQGPGEASVFHDGAGYWLLYSPWRSLAPLPDVPPRPVYITRTRYSAPPAPTWPAAHSRRRPTCWTCRSGRPRPERGVRAQPRRRRSSAATALPLA